MRLTKSEKKEWKTKLLEIIEKIIVNIKYNNNFEGIFITVVNIVFREKDTNKTKTKKHTYLYALMLDYDIVQNKNTPYRRQ